MKRILIAMMVVAVCGLFSSCEEDGLKVTTYGYQLQGSYNVVLQGKVTNEGKKRVTEVGFYYSDVSSIPTSTGYKKVCGHSEGEFVATVPRSPDRDLSFCAYAKVSSGAVTYGSVRTIYRD